MGTGGKEVLEEVVFILLRRIDNSAELLLVWACLPDSGGSQAVPHLQQVVGVPHILRLLWHQSHLTEKVQVNKPGVSSY